MRSGFWSAPDISSAPTKHAGRIGVTEINMFMDMNRRAPDSGECGLASASRGGGPGDRRYEQRWIPSSPLSKGKPSFRILKIDFACLPPHPPRQGKAKFPDITLGLVLERGGRGACSLAPTVQYTGTQPYVYQWCLRAGNRSSEPDFGECGLPRFRGGGPAA